MNVLYPTDLSPPSLSLEVVTVPLTKHYYRYNSRLLHHPSPSAETRITTDASGTAVGGQLEQKMEKG